MTYKNNVNGANKRNLRGFSRLLLAFISITLLLSAGLIIASAQDMYEYNQIRADEESGELHSLQISYTQKASAGDYPTSVASNVNKIIQSYRDTLSSMPHDAPDKSEDLTDELATVREQGIAAASLAWIVYAHSERVLPEYSTQTDNEILLKYKEYKDITDSKKKR